MTQIDYSEMPVLTGKRIILDSLRDADTERISQLRSNPIVNQYIERPPVCSTEDASNFISKIRAAYAERSSYYWAIRPLGSEELIGTICVFKFDIPNQTAEIGFELDPSWHRQGIMNEAAEMVIDFVEKNLPLKGLEAWAMKVNAGSVGVLRKNGFMHAPDREQGHDMGDFQIFYRNFPRNT